MFNTIKIYLYLIFGTEKPAKKNQEEV